MEHCAFPDVWLGSGCLSLCYRMGCQYSARVSPRLRAADRGLHVSA